MKSKRKKPSGAFKVKVAIEALQKRESLSELTKKFVCFRKNMEIQTLNEKFQK